MAGRKMTAKTLTIALILALATSIIQAETTLFNITSHYCYNGQVLERRTISSIYVDNVYCKDKQRGVTKAEKITWLPNRIDCCGDKFVDVPMEWWSEGVESYTDNVINSTEYACFNDVAVLRGHEDWEAGRTEPCGPDQDNCKFFDPSLDFCCGNEMYAAKESLCCDNVPINTSTHLCCTEVEETENSPDLKVTFEASVEIPEDQRKEPIENRGCCHDQYMNVATHVCCEVELPDVTEGPNTTYNLVEIPEDQRNVTIADHDCCRGEYMNAKTHFCCASGAKDKEGQTVLFCCGDEFVTDTNNQMCVGNTVQLKDSTKQSSCGSEVYDASFQECHDEQVYNVDKIAGEKFCEFTKSVYRHKDETCCKEGLIARSEDDNNAERNECCGEGDNTYV